MAFGFAVGGVTLSLVAIFVVAMLMRSDGNAKVADGSQTVQNRDAAVAPTPQPNPAPTIPGGTVPLVPETHVERPRPSPSVEAPVPPSYGATERAKSPVVNGTPPGPIPSAPDPFSGVPQQFIPPQQFTAPNALAPTHQQIVLPSGRVLDLSIFIPNFSENLTAAKDTRPMMVSYPSGKQFALLGHVQDTLHGPSFAFYENGDPMLYVVYQNGLRHGNMVVLDEQKRVRIAGQYAKGKKDGYCCVFSEGELRLIHECDNGNFVRDHLVQAGKVTKSFDTIVADTDTDLTAARAELAELETELKENETAVKRWVREADEETRWARAADNSVQNRNDSQARINARTAARANQVRSLRIAAGH